MKQTYGRPASLARRTKEGASKGKAGSVERNEQRCQNLLRRKRRTNERTNERTDNEVAEKEKGSRERERTTEHALPIHCSRRSPDCTQITYKPHLPLFQYFWSGFVSKGRKCSPARKVVVLHAVAAAAWVSLLMSVPRWPEANCGRDGARKQRTRSRNFPAPTAWYVLEMRASLALRRRRC